MNSVFLEHSISVIPDWFSFCTKGSQSQREKNLFSHKIIFCQLIFEILSWLWFLNIHHFLIIMCFNSWWYLSCVCVCVCVCVLSRVGLFGTPWTVAARLLYPWVTWQEYWCGLPLPSPGDLPNPETESTSPALAVGFFRNGITWEAPYFTWASPIT